MPLSAEDAKIADELSRLLKMASEMRKSSNDRGTINYVKFAHFQVSAENILEVGFGTNSIYHKRFLETYKMEFPPNYNRLQMYKQTIDVQVGILRAAFDALNRGLTKDLFYEREMIVFSDLLDQANEFLENYITYLAAGVYGRIVLETTIREFAKLKLRENYDPKMKFDRLITKLRTDGFIMHSFEEKLRYNYTIGSNAAHNDPEFARYNKKELRQFLTFVKDEILTLK